jgi:hypothetical protein
MNIENIFEIERFFILNMNRNNHTKITHSEKAARPRAQFKPIKREKRPLSVRDFGLLHLQIQAAKAHN